MKNNTLVVTEKAKKAIREYEMLRNGSTVIVGISGGADSVCLLHLLSTLKEEYNLKLIASHINHGIRGDEAKRDSEFSKDFSESLNVEFRLKEFDCVKEAKENNETLEEAGRRIRYAFFNSLIEDENSVIATAHNSNDNAETIIFNITRGATLNGAKGIPPKRDNIIRPLIFCTRKEIEGYCEENDLCFVTDSTNLSDDYTRNRIRHLVLPELEKVNPSVIGAFLRFSESVKLDLDYLDFVANEAFEKIKIKEHSYDVNKLNELHPSIKNRIVFKAISSFSGEIPDSKKIQAVSDCINEKSKIQLYKNCYCETKKNELKFFENGNNNFEKNQEEIELSVEDFSLDFGGFFIESKIHPDFSQKVNNFLLDNLIDCDTINGNLILRTRREGDRITLFKRKVTKSLKKLFIEEDIPKEERDLLPVLADEKGVVWVYGFGVNKNNAINKNTKKIMALKGGKND